MFGLTDEETKHFIFQGILSVLAAGATAFFSGKEENRFRNFGGGLCSGMVVAIINLVNQWALPLEYLLVGALSAFGNILWPALGAFSLKYFKKKTDEQQ